MRTLGSRSLIRVGADDDILQEPQDFLQLAGSATAVLVVGGGRVLQVIVAVITDGVTLRNYEYY